MIYRDFQGLKLSALGFGAMRLPVIDGDDGAFRASRRKTASVLPGLPQLRAGLPAADQDLRDHGRLCCQARIITR